MKVLTARPYHRTRKFFSFYRWGNWNIQSHQSFRCGWTIDTEKPSGVWGILWVHCILYLISLHYAMFSYVVWAGDTPEPLQCLHFPWKIDDWKEPSVDILIWHRKKWSVFAPIARLFKNKEQWELLSWAIWVLSSIYTLFFSWMPSLKLNF